MDHASWRTASIGLRTLHVNVSSSRIFLAARSLWMNDLLARWFIPDAICLENRRNWISNALEF